MLKINFFNECQQNIDQSAIEKKAAKVLQEYGVDDVQFDLSMVSPEKIQEYNEKYLNHQGKTDVLSFPHHTAQQRQDVPLPPGELLHLGEILICLEVAEQAATDSGRSLTDQLCFYTEHGLMHLLGYHHL